MKKIFYGAWEVFEVLFIALVAVAAIKYFLIQPFIVNGASMEPNFYNGDYLLVDEISYNFKDPSRGDVIVFRAPQNPSVYYIKRIVGLPGEKIEINDDSVKIYDKENLFGFEIDEPYLQNKKGIWGGHASMTLKDGQYFVLGDNRLNSLDSRYWGALNKADIIGLVKLRLWPINDFSIFRSVKYSTLSS